MLLSGDQLCEGMVGRRLISAHPENKERRLEYLWFIVLLREEGLARPLTKFVDGLKSTFFP